MSEKADEFRMDVLSIYGKETRQPYVQVSWNGQNPVVMSIEDAHRFAMNLLTACAASLCDSFLVGFLEATVGVPPDESQDVLHAFRDYRHKRMDELPKDEPAP